MSGTDALHRVCPRATSCLTVHVRMLLTLGRSALLRIDTHVQPTHGKIVDLLHDGLTNQRYAKLEASVAYTTTSGTSALRDGGAFDVDLNRMRCQWLTGFDWCRSDPVALEALSQRLRSNVRIFDGQAVAALPGCAPTRPFHPKGFLFTGPNAALLISGSGNLSRSGLTRGVELNTVIEVRDPVTPNERAAWKAIQRYKTWFASTWRAADEYSLLHRAYTAAWLAARPVLPTTDDDIAKPAGRGYSPDELISIRRATRFWIEAGNLTQNLGRGMPGNQLMMRGLTRVFFGFPPEVVPKQTPIGVVDVVYGGSPTPNLSLEFAHNGMDRLNLPRPAAGGPASYDQHTLVFARRPVRGRVVYDLELAGRKEARQLRRQSDLDGLTFAMPGQGRSFGFTPN